MFFLIVSGFILKRVNHSVSFGAGYLHTNTIESLWHQIKMITNNFSGLNIEKLKVMFNNDETSIKNYLDRWIFNLNDMWEDVNICGCLS